MNGDLKVIYDKVVEVGKDVVKLEVTQKLQHEANKKDIKSLFDKIRIVGDNQVKISALEKGHTIMWFMVSSVIIGGVIMKVFL